MLSRTLCSELSHQVCNREGRVEKGEEEQGKTFQFREVKPTRVREVVEDGGDDGFVKEEAVVDAS